MGDVQLGGMYYIVDSFGNYYFVNGENQLVTAGGKDEAGVFSYQEAIERIGSGKKARFYSVKAIELGEKTGLENGETEEEQEEYCWEDEEYIEDIRMDFSYDMKGIDWNEYLAHFCYIASGLQNYRDELSRALSDVEAQICDILHYVELYDQAEEDDCVYMIELLKECREQRRDVKDELFRIDCFQKAIGTSGNVAKAKEGIKQMKKLNSRRYTPRKLADIFKDCPPESQRRNKLIRALADTTCIDYMRTAHEVKDVYEEMEEENMIMEYTSQKTIFDGKDNNWVDFARQQAEFYGNAEQYMYNLQEDIAKLDDSIEDMLCSMEDANYNVTQGYRFFKELKELRNTRKSKQKELECLRILTEPFNCNNMAAALEKCAEEVEVVCQPKDNKEESEEMPA